jgi:predicted enzyme related to lactoylglutathione lyase
MAVLDPWTQPPLVTTSLRRLAECAEMVDFAFEGGTMTTAAPVQILGRHVWSELMTTDTKAAENFYDNVVGWTSEPFGNSPQPYTQFKREGGVGVAGLMERPKGMNMPPFWSMYIAVPKFEDAVAHIKRLGGSELSGVIDVPTVGRMQMLKDPQGAAFYIIQPEPRDNPPDADPEIGQPSWIELITTDQASAMSFYQQIFGWQPSQAMDMGPAGTYQMFNRGDRMIGGMMNKTPEMAQVPTHWAIYFRVPDINAATQRIKAGGGKILNGPMEVPGGDWVVNAMDPQGAAFALHQKKTA